MSNVTISPLSTAIPALIDPALLAHRQRHPRYQPALHLFATTDRGDQAIGLVTHTRWQRQLAQFEVGEVELFGSTHFDVTETLLAAAAETAVAAGIAWLRCALPLSIAGQWGMIPATLHSRITWHGGDGTLIPATLTDVADLVALDQHAPTPRCVTPLRYEPDWRWQIVDQPPLVVHDQLGRVVGYVLLRDEHVIEGRAVDAGAARDLLGRLPHSTHELWLTPDHPLAQAALELGATLRLHLPPADSILPVWIVIDPLAALRAHQAALRVRIAASRYADWYGSVALSGKWGATRIECRAGTVHISVGTGIADIDVWQLSNSGLSALLLGRRSVSDLRATNELRCADHGLEVVETLFPVSA